MKFESFIDEFLRYTQFSVFFSKIFFFFLNNRNMPSFYRENGVSAKNFYHYYKIAGVVYPHSCVLRNV